MKNFMQPWVIRKAIYYGAGIVGTVLVALGIVSADTAETFATHVVNIVTPLVLALVGGLAGKMTGAHSDIGASKDAGAHSDTGVSKDTKVLVDLSGVEDEAVFRVADIKKILDAAPKTTGGLPVYDMKSSNEE